MAEPKKPMSGKVPKDSSAKAPASRTDIRSLLQQTAADLASGSTPGASSPSRPVRATPTRSPRAKSATPRVAKATATPTRSPRAKSATPRVAKATAPPTPTPRATPRVAKTTAVSAPPPAPPVAPALPWSPSAPVDMAAIDRELESVPATAYQRPVSPPPLPQRHDRRSRKGLVAAAVVVILALAGGGVGVMLARRDTAPSKAEYIADADDICRPANGPVVAIVEPTSFPELAIASSTVVNATTSQLGQLRRLDQPGGDQRDQVDAVFSSLDGSIRATQRLQEAASRSNDAATISATKDARAAFTDAGAKASTFGFGACATGLQSGVNAVFGGSQAVIKAGFVAKAEAACRAVARDAEEIALPAGPRDISRYIDEIGDLLDKLAADIEALPVPPGDEAIVAEIIDAAKKVNAKGRDYLQAIADQDESRTLAMEKELNSLQTAVDAKLDAYGLGTCGSNFGGD